MWLLLDPDSGFFRLTTLGEMVFTLYAYWLLWRYRKQEPTAMVVVLLALSYLPVLPWRDWHYMLTGWFIRCALFWPMIARLMWRQAKENRQARHRVLGIEIL